MNDFQERAEAAKRLSKALFVQVCPIVTAENREEYEAYTLRESGWLAEGLEYQEKLNHKDFIATINHEERNNVNDTYNLEYEYDNIAKKIFVWDAAFKNILATGPGPYYPLWQQSPILPNHGVNFDIAVFPTYGQYLSLSAKTGDLALGGIITSVPGNINTVSNPLTAFYAQILSIAAGKNVVYTGDPFSQVYIPIFDGFGENRTVGAVMYAVLNWAQYFVDVLPSNAKPVHVVLENTCDGPHTYLVDRSSVQYEGPGELFDVRFSNMGKKSVFNTTSFAEKGYNFNEDLCAYSLRIYPTSELYEHYNTSTPVLLATLVAGILLFTTTMFFVYDWLVEKRQHQVLGAALRTNAIVSSLFPEQVRERLEADALQNSAGELQSFLDNGDEDSPKEGTAEKRGNIIKYKSKPIADLFLSATVMFADVEGFTEWRQWEIVVSDSNAAKQWQTPHVEPIFIDVAVAGLPVARDDHAVAIAKYAWACLCQVKQLFKRLEAVLGPDTGDLSIRIGLHSGQITAGVLRESRSRFQLFGDTVNVTSRIESSSKGGRIQLSKETADLLTAAGKEKWLIKREKLVFAKGKGEIQTFWLKGAKDAQDYGAASFSGSNSSDILDYGNQKEVASFFYRLPVEKEARLIQFNVDTLIPILKQIIALRRAQKIKSKAQEYSIVYHGENETVIDEQEDPESILIEPNAVAELRNFIRQIASMYQPNPFHNFEHASHVTLSVRKLLSRIVVPNSGGSSFPAEDHTFGITSDPLTQFACVLSSLIHDAGHPGIPNTQLVKEKTALAKAYKNTSVAEQNSIDMAWSLLMSPKYASLRQTICANEVEMRPFRQLVVNSVLATDIVDKKLKALRNARWDKAFKDLDEDKNCRATLSKRRTSHTMQHWMVFRKWNERLFEEMYKAYKEGRAEKDPSETWYNRELGFFDVYILPLAKKLKECGVFGVSSDEYLNYAMRNRQEWELKGKEVVAMMLEKVKKTWDDIYNMAHNKLETLAEAEDWDGTGGEHGIEVVGVAEEGVSDDGEKTENGSESNTKDFFIFV